MSEVVLHGFDRSSCTCRVRIVLALKGIDYEYRRVDPRSGQMRQPEYLKVNPLSQVPALQVDGQHLAQSMAICEFLEQTHPDPPLLPSDPITRAQCRFVAETVNAAIQPMQNLGMLLEMVERYGDERLRRVLPGGPTPPQAPEEGEEPWPHFWIRKRFAGLEQRLAGWAGSCCFGDTVTLADAFLFPQVSSARMFSIDLDPYPTIRRIDEHLQTLPAFAAVRPG